MKNRILIALVAAVVLAPASAPAQAPQSPGEGGIFCFVERLGGVADVFVGIVTPAIPPGTPSGPLPASSVVPIPLGGLVSPAGNRRAQQSPKESDLLIVRTPTGPVVFVHTNFGGIPAVESIDFRVGFPPLQNVTLLAGLLGPYDLLDDAANQRVVASSINAATGAVQAWGISYAAAVPGTPVGPYTAIGPPSPYVERMAIDPVTGRVLLPSTSAVEMLDAALNGVAAVLMPPGQTVATNVETAFNGALPENCLLGTVAPGLATGGWVAFDGTGAAVQSATFPPSPSGTFRPSPGFTDIGLSTNAAGTTATFLLADSAALPLGPGVVVQLVNETVPTVPGVVLAQPAAPVPAGSPFGNPTDTEPCYFMVSGIPDAIGAVGAGGQWSYAGFVGAAGGIAAPTAPLASFIDPAHIGRPQALPGVGFPATVPAVAICESTAVAQVEIFPLAAAPAAPTVQPVFGAPIVPILGSGGGQTVSTRLTRVGASQAGSFPAMPIFGQGFTTAGGGSRNALAAQLAAPPAATVIAPTLLNPVPTLGVPAGAFVQPPGPAPAGVIGARDPAYAYNGQFLWAAFPEALTGGLTRVTIHATGVVGGFAEYVYVSPALASGTTLVTEIVTL